MADVRNRPTILDESDLPSPRDSGNFWAEVRRRGTPFATGAADADERSATFFYRSGSAERVYLEANRLTDKHRVERGSMYRIEGTDIWWATLEVDAASVFTYGFRELPGSGGFAEAVAAQRRTGIPAVGDPFNRHPGIDVTGTGPLSVASLDRAPVGQAWSRQDATPPRGTLSRSVVELPGVGRTAGQRTYIPPRDAVDAPLRLLVLTDAEIWFDRLHLAHALEAAVAAGDIEPLAVVGIATRDNAERVELLGANPAFVDDLADTVVPAARAAVATTHPLGAGSATLAGQSLGGLTALLGALQRPDTFDRVLAHSPSLWWTPDRSVTPANYTSDHQPWITSRFATEPATAAGIDLRVGTREDITNDHVDQLHDVLALRGYDTTAARFSGGHDFACWRHALLAGLQGK